MGIGLLYVCIHVFLYSSNPVTFVTPQQPTHMCKFEFRRSTLILKDHNQVVATTKINIQEQMKNRSGLVP